MPDKLKIYTTRDSELEARMVVEDLRDNGRRAYVDRVRDMALRNDPLTPRTTDRFAVIVEDK